MNISLGSNYNPVFWNTKLAGAATFLQESGNSVFSFDILGWCIEKFTIRKLTSQLKAETEKINQLFSDDVTVIAGILKDQLPENGEKVHKDLIKILDLFEGIEKTSISTIENKVVQELLGETIKFMDALKKLEMLLRLTIWPDDNKILLTYNEIKDLYENQHLCN